MISGRHSLLGRAGYGAGVSFVALLLVATSVFADRRWDPENVEASDRKAKLVVSPTYPVKAWRERRQGRVIVCFDIRADGRVRKAFVLASSNRVFNKSALKAVRLSKFEEREPGTEPEDSCRTFRFLLEPEKVAASVTP